MSDNRTTVRVRTADQERINQMQGTQWEIVKQALDALEDKSLTEDRVREIVREEINE